MELPENYDLDHEEEVKGYRVRSIKLNKMQNVKEVSKPLQRNVFGIMEQDEKMKA